MYIVEAVFDNSKSISDLYHSLKIVRCKNAKSFVNFITITDTLQLRLYDVVNKTDKYVRYKEFIDLYEIGEILCAGYCTTATNIDVLKIDIVDRDEWLLAENLDFVRYFYANVIKRPYIERDYFTNVSNDGTRLITDEHSNVDLLVPVFLNYMIQNCELNEFIKVDGNKLILRVGFDVICAKDINIELKIKDESWFTKYILMKKRK